MVAVSFAIRLASLGKLTLLVFEVHNMLLHCVPPLLVNGVALPVVSPGIAGFSVLQSIVGRGEVRWLVVCGGIG